MATTAERALAEKGWMTYADIEDYCSVSRWTILRAVQNGELSASHVGRKVLVRRSDLDQWLESRKG